MRKPYWAILLVAAPALAAPPIQPGKWETTSRMVDLQMAGLPPEARKQMMQAQTMTHCVTAKDAEANPQKLLDASGGKCRFERFTMQGGKLESAMTCEGGMRSETSGVFTPTSYKATSRMTNGPMKMTAEVSARRIGAC